MSEFPKLPKFIVDNGMRFMFKIDVYDLSKFSCEKLYTNERGQNVVKTIVWGDFIFCPNGTTFFKKRKQNGQIVFGKQRGLSLAIGKCIADAYRAAE